MYINIEYDQLQKLILYIPNLKIKSERIKFIDRLYSDGNISSRDTYIDGVLRKLESWYQNGIKKIEYNYIKNEIQICIGKIYK